jgi:hypothetical protein
MSNAAGWIVAIVGFVIIYVLIAGALALVTMLIWNSLLSDIFSARSITLWEAYLLTVFVNLLFSGVRYVRREDK